MMAVFQYILDPYMLFFLILGGALIIEPSFLQIF